MADSEYSNIADATTIASLEFPATGLLDNFNRTDDPDAPPGAGWSDVWEYIVGIVVFSNGCIEEDADQNWGFGSNRWNTEFAADQEAYVTLKNRVGEVGTVGLYLRTTANYYENVYYSAHFSFDILSGIAHVNIDKFTGGVGTTPLGTFQFPYMMEVGDKMGFRAIGDTLEAYYNRQDGGWGLPVLSVTDSDHIGPGYICLGLGGAQFQEIGDLAVDDFGGGEI